MPRWGTLYVGFWIGLSLLWAFTGQAEAPRRYASIVVDADTLEIIHARQIDEPRFPASLTKVMTLYLTFDALDAGTLTLDQKLKVSRHAAATPPVKLGLRAGTTLTVEDAIQALTVRSANDAAVVLAEALAGNEDAFAVLMTARAERLGLRNTHFRNPHGLPDSAQLTTARDMAKLATSILNNHRRYYHYFGQKSFRYKGRTYKNTNSLLHDMPEVDGFKTGFTNASGYNLIISAQKEDRRVIAVVLGGASGNSRNQHMRDLLRRGFTSMAQMPQIKAAPIVLAPVTLPTADDPKLSVGALGNSPSVSSTPRAAPALDLATHAVRLRGRNQAPVTIISQGAPMNLPKAAADTAWSIQIGNFPTQQQAVDHLTVHMRYAGHPLTEQTGWIMPVRRGPALSYQARFGNLNYAQAQAACLDFQKQGRPCFVMAPAG